MKISEEILTQNDCIWWICPICEWAITGDEQEYARYDYECPGCGCVNCSEFIPVAAA